MREELLAAGSAGGGAGSLVVNDGADFRFGGEGLKLPRGDVTKEVGE